jgi:16S rRNA (guanine966-N2)-methyltransferase
MSTRKLGELRIIGGQWRSRLVGFSAKDGVRPTPDRVRQTVFDWLAPRIEGAHCLDLFAGSGALGLEALSRGAGKVRFVETGREQVAKISAAVAQLGGGDRAEVRLADAMVELAHPKDVFDVVFLDPPYSSGLLQRALTLLPGLLKPEARVYVEWPGEERPPMPDGYTWLREKSAGRVSFGLLTYTQEGSA